MLLNPASPAASARLPSTAEMASYDAATIAAGIPVLELMERAGVAAAEFVTSLFEHDHDAVNHVVVLCGPGNNGGDGLVAARHLHEMGHAPLAVMTATDRYSSDCRLQLQKAAWAGVEILFVGAETSVPEGIEGSAVSLEQLRARLAGSRIIIDAMLGTGQRSEPRGAIAAVLQELRAFLEGSPARPRLVALDLPTGIDADKGVVFDPHFVADHTLAIQLIKRGMLQYPAREVCGEIELADIGIESSEAEFSLLRFDQIRLPGKRAGHFHKGMAGHVFIIGGSRNMQGAPALSSLAALRSGAGLVTMAALRGVTHYPPAHEVMLHFVGGEAGEFFTAKHVEELIEQAQVSDVVVLGPGLGVAEPTREMVRCLVPELMKLAIPLVIDADALNILAELPEPPLLSSAVITPHPGEAARLLGLTASAVQSDRYEAVRSLSRRYGAVAVLKGAATVVYSGEHGYVNSSGNPLMATAGSGDVLSGVIAGLLAQFAGHTDLRVEAAKSGVYLHGRAGDLARHDLGGPLIASDILRALPHAFQAP